MRSSTGLEPQRWFRARKIETSSPVRTSIIIARLRPLRAAHHDDNVTLPSCLRQQFDELGAEPGVVDASMSIPCDWIGGNGSEIGTELMKRGQRAADFADTLIHASFAPVRVRQPSENRRQRKTCERRKSIDDKSL